MLFDIDGTSVLYSYSQGTAQQITHEATHLLVGTYYIRIVKDDRSFYWGSYTLKAIAIPSEVAHVVGANDAIEGAFALDRNTTVSGHLGYRGQSLPSQQSAWFKIQVPSDGSLSFELTTSGGGTTPIRQSDGDLNTAEYGNGVGLFGIDGTSRLYSYSQGPATQITHQITHLQAGTYYIRLLKDDRSFYWGSYTLNWNTVSDGTNSYNAWRSTPGYFSAAELTDPLISGLDADPDADGIPNLIEFALRTNPRITSTSALPQPGMSNGRLTLTFRQVAGGSGYRAFEYITGGLRYTVQWSTNLDGTWQTGGSEVFDVISVTTNGDGTDTVVISPVSNVTANHPKFFLRLKLDLL